MPQQLHHLHLLDSKGAKHRQVSYRRFGLRSVCSTHSPEGKEVRHHDEAYRNAGRVPTTIGPRRPHRGSADRGAAAVGHAAIETEVDEYVAARAKTVDAAGRRGVVRNGHLPKRVLQTPLGDVTVQQPRVRDRRPADERETFRSATLPPYLQTPTGRCDSQTK